MDTARWSPVGDVRGAPQWSVWFDRLGWPEPITPAEPAETSDWSAWPTDPRQLERGPGW